MSTPQVETLKVAALNAQDILELAYHDVIHENVAYEIRHAINRLKMAFQILDIPLPPPPSGGEG